MLLAKRQIMIEPVVRAMYDLVHRERCGQPVRMRLVVRGEFFPDPMQPFVQQRRRPRIPITGIDRRPLNSAGMDISKSPFRSRRPASLMAQKQLHECRARRTA